MHGTMQYAMGAMHGAMHCAMHSVMHDSDLSVLKGRLQTQGPNWPPTFPNCFLSNVIRKSVHFIISLVVFMIIGATITFGKKNDEKTRRTF